MNITELKELAEKATGGEWVVGSSPFDQSRHVYCKSPVTDGEESWLPLIASTDDGETLVDHEANAAYIAAANPAEILELIAKLEDAQGEIRALRATEAGLVERLAALEKAIMDAEPVAWLHRNKGGALTADQKWLSRDNMRPYADACDTPLYTLNGIKKP